jgi:transposase
MPSPAAPPLDVSASQREVLEKVARSRTAAHREVVRAKVLLDAADGIANVVIARRHDVTAVTVRSWRKAFEAEGLTRWGKVAKGRGKKPTVSDAKVAEIVELTTKTRPKGHTHWSTRTMAERAEVSKDTVRRIWNELGLQPHRVETFKVSNDPRFSEKLIDVVGLYLNPRAPRGAVSSSGGERPSPPGLSQQGR